MRGPSVAFQFQNSYGIICSIIMYLYCMTNCYVLSAGLYTTVGMTLFGSYYNDTCKEHL